MVGEDPAAKFLGGVTVITHLLDVVVGIGFGFGLPRTNVVELLSAAHSTAQHSNRQTDIRKCYERVSE